jgi:phage antirepressor YoqD-like protein
MASDLEKANVLINVNQAAKILGCTTGRIRQLLLAEQLPGRKVTETSWILAKKDVERYAKNNPRTIGRKRVSETV